MGDSIFSYRLLNLINEKGITNKKLLDDLNISKNAIINWTSRGNTPSGDVLKTIANYFNVLVDYLVGNSENKEKTQDDMQLKFDIYLYKICTEIKDMSDEGKQDILEYIQFKKSKRNKI